MSISVQKRQLLNKIYYFVFSLWFLFRFKLWKNLKDITIAQVYWSALWSSFSMISNIMACIEFTKPLFVNSPTVKRITFYGTKQQQQSNLSTAILDSDLSWIFPFSSITLSFVYFNSSLFSFMFSFMACSFFRSVHFNMIAYNLWDRKPFVAASSTSDKTKKGYPIPVRDYF